MVYIEWRYFLTVSDNTSEEKLLPCGNNST